MNKIVITIAIVATCVSTTFGSACSVAAENIKKFEGFVSDVYLCQAGKETIGYGFTDKKHIAKVTMTRAEADVILDGYVKDLEKFVKSEIGNTKLNDNQMAAVISLVYNIGRANFKESTLLKDLRSGNFDKVPADFRMWNKVRNKDKKLVVSKGLVNRRIREVMLWLR